VVTLGTRAGIAWSICHSRAGALVLCDHAILALFDDEDMAVRSWASGNRKAMIEIEWRTQSQ
jgi:hypothetical protein